MSVIEFQNLLLSYHNLLQLFALKLTANEEDAKDLTQETLLKAITYRQHLLTKASFKSWLYTIMKNIFINQYRRGNKLNEIKDAVIHQGYVSFAGAQKLTSPEQILSVDRLEAAIESLEDGYRIPFKMKLEGYKYEEIGNQMNLPVGTIKSRIFFARKQLKAKLPEYNIHE